MLPYESGKLSIMPDRVHELKKDRVIARDRDIEKPYHG